MNQNFPCRSLISLSFCLPWTSRRVVWSTSPWSLYARQVYAPLSSLVMARTVRVPSWTCSDTDDRRERRRVSDRRKNSQWKRRRMRRAVIQVVRETPTRRAQRWSPATISRRGGEQRSLLESRHHEREEEREDLLLFLWRKNFKYFYKQTLFINCIILQT